MRKRNVWPANEKFSFSLSSSAKHFVNSLVWTPAVSGFFSRPKVLFIRRGGRAFLGGIHGWKLASRRLACQCQHHATFMLLSLGRGGSPAAKKVLAHPKKSCSKCKSPQTLFPALEEKKCGLRPANQQIEQQFLSIIYSGQRHNTNKSGQLSRRKAGAASEKKKSSLYALRPLHCIRLDKLPSLKVATSGWRT